MDGLRLLAAQARVLGAGYWVHAGARDTLCPLPILRGTGWLLGPRPVPGAGISGALGGHTQGRGRQRSLLLDGFWHLLNGKTFFLFGPQYCPGLPGKAALGPERHVLRI